MLHNTHCIVLHTISVTEILHIHHSPCLCCLKIVKILNSSVSGKLRIIMWGLVL